MSKLSKIVIFVLLTAALGAGVFAVSRFSKAENGTTEDNDLSGSVYVCPNATNLEEINPLCEGIIILKEGQENQGMLLTTTTYEEKEYYLVQGFQNGGAGRFGITENSIKDINDYIQGLPDSAFANNPKQRKNALKNKLKEVFIKIDNKQYQDAINKLRNDIRTKTDGDPSAEDWIIDSDAKPDAREGLLKTVDGLTLYLKGLMR